MTKPASEEQMQTVKNTVVRESKNSAYDLINQVLELPLGFHPIGHDWNSDNNDWDIIFNDFPNNVWTRTVLRRNL